MIRHNSLLLVTNSSNHWGAGQRHRCLCVFFFFSQSVMEVIDCVMVLEVVDCVIVLEMTDCCSAGGD